MPVTKTRKCPECHGHGKQLCTTCHGEGEIIIAVDGKPVTQARKKPKKPKKAKARAHHAG